MEQQIISAVIQSKECYDLVRDYLDPTSFSPEAAAVLSRVDDFYETDKKADSCDVSIIRTNLLTTAPKGAMQDQLSDFLEVVLGYEVSIPNVVKEVIAQQQKACGHRLAQAILTNDNKATLTDLVEQYVDVLNKTDVGLSDEEEYIAPDITSLVQQHVSDDNVVFLAPKSLNDRLRGGVPKPRLIIASARPESGKTALSVSNACANAFLGKKVIYYQNEESVVDVLLRAVSNLSGMTYEQLVANPQKAQELAESRGLGNIVFKYATRNNLWELNALMKKHKPDLVIVDQLRNLQMKTDGLTELLERASKGLRRLAAKHNCVVLAITQAGESAQDKAVLSMSDIDSSKTGLQGACDILLLMGNTPQLEANNRRCLTLAKNKVSGVHDSWYVAINKQLSRIHDG